MVGRRLDIEPEVPHALLAVPSRVRIVEIVLAAAPAAVTARQIADELGMHVTTVRVHLGLLADAGLVVAERLASNGRGRPSIGYRPGAMDPVQVRGQMIDALAWALARRSSGDRALAAGRWWAQRLPDPGPDEADEADEMSAMAAMSAAFTRLGFAPRIEGDRMHLEQCPFEDAARHNPEVVCRVHLGLAQGISARASRTGRHPRLDLVPFADSTGCRLRVEPTRTPSRPRSGAAPD